jgi:hypothetical protein
MPRRSRGIAMWVVAGLLAVGLPARGCPFSPWPRLGLWEGIHEADLIVTGQVVDVEVDKLGLTIARLGEGANDLLERFGSGVRVPTSWPLAAVTVDIHTTIKGPPSRRVTFMLEGVESEAVAPTDPMIFFLRREGGRWYPTRLPYLYSGPRQLKDLWWAIKTATALGPGATETEVLDWRIETAVRTGTRGEAVYALAGLRPLPEPALRRLAEGFVKDIGPQSTVAGMLELLAPYPSPEVDGAVETLLRTRVDRATRSRIEKLQAARVGATSPASPATCADVAD